MTLQPEEKLREALLQIIDPEISAHRENTNLAKCRALVAIAERQADEITELFASYRPDGVGGEDDLDRVARALEPKLRGFGHGDVPRLIARELAETALSALARLPALPVEGGGK